VTATYVGSLSIGGAVPGAAAAASAGVGGFGGALSDLEGRAEALAEALAAMALLPPPSFAAQLTIATQTLAAINLAIATPGMPPPPSLSAALAILTAQLTALQALVTTMQGQLDIVVAFQTLLAAAGVHVIAYDGDTSSLASDVGGALGPVGSGHCNALALVTTNGATWTAMSSVFKVTP
jgi:hypothetical protein